MAGPTASILLPTALNTNAAAAVRERIQSEDHRILGCLALQLASELNGVIDMTGDIASYTRDAAILRHPDYLVHDHASLFSAELLKQWLAHPDFRMVK